MAQFRRHVSRGVAASSLLLLLTTAAQGAIYSGRFDPTGDGINFPGFTGEGIFNIADNCVNQGDGYFLTQNFDSSGCGASYMTSAAVNLYDPSLTDPLTNPVDHFSLSGSYDVIGVLVEGGVISGVDTDILGPATNDGGYAPNGTGVPPFWSAGTPFWLQFQSGCLDENNIHAGPSSCTDPVYIYMGPNQTQSKPATDVTFQTVPEPGTLPLLLSALGLGWIVRRRAKA